MRIDLDQDRGDRGNRQPHAACRTRAQATEAAPENCPRSFMASSDSHARNHASMESPKSQAN